MVLIHTFEMWKFFVYPFFTFPKPCSCASCYVYFLAFGLKDKRQGLAGETCPFLDMTLSDFKFGVNGWS